MIRPWQWCNLDRNPFGEWTREDRATLAVVDFAAAWSRDGGLPDFFPTPRLAWQWIGPCGFGKTTRLLSACREFKDAHYVYVTQEKTCDPIPEAAVLMIDEADRMPSRLFRMVMKTGIPLMLGTHRCLRRTLHRHDYRVVSSFVENENDAERLVEIVSRRIQACRLNIHQPLPQFSLCDAQALIDQYGRDFRAIEHVLYLCVQQQRFCDGELSFKHSSR